MCTRGDEQETIRCKVGGHGRLANELRERYGSSLLEDEQLFRPIVQETWWDKQEVEREEAPSGDESPDQ